MPMPTLPSPGAQVRPEEILSWLKAWQGEPIEAWCAVDDRPLLMERGGAGLIGHFVEVDEMFGLTELAVERVLAGIVLSELTSPTSPTSSSSAARTTASIEYVGCGGGAIFGARAASSAQRIARETTRARERFDARARALIRAPGLEGDDDAARIGSARRRVARYPHARARTNDSRNRVHCVR